MKQMIEQSMTAEELAQRQQENRLAVKERTSESRITIQYGNFAEKLPSKSAKPRYRWKLFVQVPRSKDHKISTAALIDRVEVYLNPGISAAAVELTSPPFELERQGTYEFGLQLKVYFKAKWRLEPYTTHYEVSLEAPKSVRSFIINL
eukprot:TRINITY_DN8602_c0_g1_i15.p1 TRINITY_DN8602_c0_g1~~TRINITY_DN8602_c0_g1_i15.p1  ORF type:complete len:160 (+),score=29.64 TRINITY_DN8602_c0_g1_i15:38-481(+)